jgi:glycosyltransferase involved in cell wall biosynthesis
VERARGGFDAIVYCIGNSEYHTGALRWLRRRPGVVLAHDVRLTELYFHGAHRGAAPEGFAAALRAMYPSLPDDVGAGGRLLAAEAEAAGVLMAREVVHRAERFLTTSQFAADLASTDVDPAERVKIAVAPYAYPDVAAVSEPPVDGVVASFGVVNEIKRSSVVVDAFAELAETRPELRLVFVGPVAVEEEARIRAQAETKGIGPQVEITGALDEATYDRWLGSVTLAVQLRATSNGETSGAVADCLAHGVPTVVSDLGTASELPDGCVVKVAPGIGASALAAVLGDLLDDRGRRARLGDEARGFVRAHGFGWGAEALAQWLARPTAARRPR